MSSSVLKPDRHSGVHALRIALGRGLLVAVAIAAAACSTVKPADDAATPPRVTTLSPEAQRAADIDALAKRLRGASRADVAIEWAQLAREGSPGKQVLLMLHPLSPQPDEDGAFAQLESLSAPERRAVLRGYSGFLAEQHRADERLRDTLNTQLERVRRDLRDEQKKSDSASARADVEKQRADGLAAKSDDLQRTLARLREIDKRLNERARAQTQ